MKTFLVVLILFKEIIYCIDNKGKEGDMQIIRSKKTIDRLNNHRFFNPSKLIAIAEKKAQIKQTPPKKEIGKQLDLFSN